MAGLDLIDINELLWKIREHIKVAPPTLTVRWWRDEETRYMSRPEYRDALERRHFNLSEVPRGDNPELDAEVDKFRDSIGFSSGFIVPMEFERLDPDPLADVVIAMRYPPPPLKMTIAIGHVVSVDDNGYPSTHESDCPFMDGGECRCPIGNP